MFEYFFKIINENGVTALAIMSVNYSLVMYFYLKNDKRVKRLKQKNEQKFLKLIADRDRLLLGVFIRMAREADGKPINSVYSKKERLDRIMNDFEKVFDVLWKRNDEPKK